METKKIPTEVYAEMTPNPATMKFMVDRLLVGGGEQVEYKDRNLVGDSSPLATELFNFPFVRSLFFSGNYVTVTKDDSLGWEMIVMQLREYIRDWLMENDVAVAYIPEGLEAGAIENAVPSSTSKSTIDYSSIPPSEHDDQIRILLDEFVRPAVEQDGGAIDFQAFKDGKVYVRLRGACSGCPSSMLTLKGGIEQLLKSKIPEVEAVVAEEA